MLQMRHHTGCAPRAQERGASLVEYVLLLGLIVIVCIGAITFLGTSGRNNINSSGSCIKAAQDGEPLPDTC